MAHRTSWWTSGHRLHFFLEEAVARQINVVDSWVLVWCLILNLIDQKCCLFRSLRHTTTNKVLFGEFSFWMSTASIYKNSFLWVFIPTGTPFPWVRPTRIAWYKPPYHLLKLTCVSFVFLSKIFGYRLVCKISCQRACRLALIAEIHVKWGLWSEWDLSRSTRKAASECLSHDYKTNISVKWRPQFVS